MENRKQFLVICLILTAGFTMIGYIYKTVADEAHEIQRERIASEERMKEADLQREREEAETDALAEQEEAEAALTEKYRQECLTVQEENEQGYEDFLNSCTRLNTIDFCIESESGQLYASNFSPGWISSCIASKKKTGW